MSDFVNTVDAIGDEALTDQIIQRTVTEIKDDILTVVGYGGFAGSKWLTVAEMPSVTKVADFGFFECTRLVGVKLPKATYLGSYALNGTAIKEANFPSLTTCGTDVFRQCASLEVADLPKMQKIGERMFYLSGKIKSVILRSGTMCTLSYVNAFSGTPIASGTGYIYVPAALLEDYKVATNWSTYAAQFRALEDYPDVTGGEIA